MLSRQPPSHGCTVTVSSAPKHSKMRVLSVIGSLRLGGAETYLSRIAPAIREFGIDMEICAFERIGANLTVLEEAGIPVYGTDNATGTYPFKAWRLLRRIGSIRRIVRAGHFDVVHTYLFWSDILGVAGARLAGCRRVIVSRRALHEWAHGQTILLHGLEQFTNLLADELIANSQTVLRDAETHEAFLPSHRTVIYNGVDLQAYQVAQPTANGPLRLVTVGALAARKGQEYLIEALALLRQAGVDAKVELVGSGPDENMLRRKVAEHALIDRVLFEGEHTDPRPYLAHSDVFVLPSRQEGFSNALLEAMASGLPVVATDVGGNAEAIVDGRGGRIVPPGQSSALAEAIAELARDRSKRIEMGRFNRQRVAELFSVRASAQNLANWYLNGPSKTAAPNS